MFNTVCVAFFKSTRTKSGGKRRPEWVAALVAAITCLGFSIHAQGQTTSVVDVVNVTVGGIIGGPTGAGFQAAGHPVAYGSVSPLVTSNGYSYQVIGNGLPLNRKGTSSPGYSTFAIGGLTANPGQSWLTSVTALGVTVTGAGASTYSYSGGVATWVWFNVWWGLTSGVVPVSVTHGPPPLGYLNLKYQILAVDYAPPGAKSNVNYGGSAMRGTATSNASSFKNTTSVTVSGDIGVNIFGFVGGGLTAMTTSSYSQQAGNSSSITIATTTTNDDIVAGPASSAVGVDHDYDVIWVWLNPIAIIYAGVNAISTGGYAFNEADPADTMDVVPLYVYQLKNPSTIATSDPSLAKLLARSWDTTGLGGLTTTDYATILAADPLVSSSYNPSTDSGHRFDLIGGSTIPYEPPPPGGQPITATGSIVTTTTSTQGKTAETDYSVGFELDFTSQLTFIAAVASSIKISNTYVTTDSWSSTINTQTGKTASYSITGPATTDKYTGPVSFQVWRDNIYGSFMFFPVE